MQRKEPCVCGKAYWPAQAWMHEGCGKAAKVEEAKPVNKSGYKDPEKRRIYMRDLMRKRRAKVRG